MRKIALALSAVSLFAFTACNNAASKIKDEESKKAQETNQQAENQANNQMNANMNQNQPNQQQKQVADGTEPVFNFQKESHNFGTIKEGAVAKHDFTFTNTGESPLIITNAKGSCGCTVPNWPREPIAPGETGTIHVEFNSSGRTGNQRKQVTIDANTVPNQKILSIRAQVEPKAKKGEGGNKANEQAAG